MNMITNLSVSRDTLNDEPRAFYSCQNDSDCYTVATSGEYTAGLFINDKRAVLSENEELLQNVAQAFMDVGLLPKNAWF